MQLFFLNFTDINTMEQNVLLRFIHNLLVIMFNKVSYKKNEAKIRS